MNTVQTNRVTMYKTVDSVLDDNNSVWSSMAQMQTAVAQLKTNLIAI